MDGPVLHMRRAAAPRLAAPAVRSARRRVTAAVIPAAGPGTRLLPATRCVPKAMVTLVGRPLIDHALDEALASGIRDVVLVVPPGAGALAAWIEDARGTGRGAASVRAVRQPRPLGLGHAVWCARGLLGPDAPFAVILPDDVIEARTPCLAQLAEVQGETGGSVVAAMEVPPDRVPDHGILDVGGSAARLARVAGMVEKPAPGRAPSKLAAVGRYVLDPAVLKRLDRPCRRAGGGETDLAGALAAEARSGRGVHALRFEGRRHDCGSKAGLLRATLALGPAHPELGPGFAADVRAAAAALAAGGGEGSGRPGQGRRSA